MCKYWLTGCRAILGSHCVKWKSTSPCHTNLYIWDPSSASLVSLKRTMLVVVVLPLFLFCLDTICCFHFFTSLGSVKKLVYHMQVGEELLQSIIPDLSFWTSVARLGWGRNDGLQKLAFPQSSCVYLLLSCAWSVTWCMHLLHLLLVLHKDWHPPLCIQIASYWNRESRQSIWVFWTDGWVLICDGCTLR